MRAEQEVRLTRLGQNSKMVDVLRDIIARNRAGQAVAIPSVCSAHPDVLRASLNLAKRLGQPIVIEATSNQVNQDGGYMGMLPQEYIAYVHRLADQVGTDRAAILFGGDHLGTQAWRTLPAQQAMEKAKVLVSDYVAAGFSKVHLDCSEGCSGEDPQLPDEVTAERSAVLAQACARQSDELMFVVGTEVPPPGGARLDEDGDILPTLPDAAYATLMAHDATFGDLAGNIGGLVVQPGVEFSPTAVHHMPLDRDPKIVSALADRPTVCLEAHSTDYQDDAVFPRLAELGFAFQKVGPALTFAYREALYALDQIRPDRGQLEAAMELEMLRQPKHWQGHYTGNEDQLKVQRHTGLADRIRYYWPSHAAKEAVTALMEDCQAGFSDTQLSEVFDYRTMERAERLDGSQAQRLIDAKIELALQPYFFLEAS